MSNTSVLYRSKLNGQRSDSQLNFSQRSFTPQSNRYQKSARNRSSTMFDKVFRITPSKNSRIMKKIVRKPHKTNEVDRCTAIHQREQYRLLIEQYRTKSLAETAKIFTKHDNVKNSAAKNHVGENLPQTQIIDLCNTPLTTKYQLPEKPITIMSQSSTDRLPLSTKATSNGNLQATPSVSNKSENRKSPAVSLQAQFEKQISPATKQTATKTDDSVTHTPPSAARSPVIDWFSPSSPYLARNFVADLMSTYGRRERDRKKILAEEETRARLFKEQRQLREDRLSELLEERLRVVPAEEEIIAELSPEADEMVDGALVPYPPHASLVEEFNICITREHMATLSSLNWLNDEVINFYMELIVKRSKEVKGLPSAHAMNTFFYPKLVGQGYKSVRRWTKRVDIFTKDLFIVPVHLGVHWTLAMVDFRSKEISYYDSMGGPNHECLAALKQYLVSEHLDKKKSEYDVSEWKTICKSTKEIPEQMNGSDCGVFTCTFAEFLSRDAPLNFTQTHMPLLRRTMVWEILNKKLVR